MTSSFVTVHDGRMHVVEDGDPRAPVLLLVHGAAASSACWDPIVPSLARHFRVVCVDLLGHGRSSTPRRGFEISDQATRLGELSDHLGVSQLIVIGHSTGCTVATALAEQRPELVAGATLIDMGPDPEAKLPEARLAHLLLTRFPGRLLWRLRSEATVRASMQSAFTRPVDIPQALVDGVMTMSHTALRETMRAPVRYLRQRSLPDRLAALELPVQVIFGADDRRWRASSAQAYRALPDARISLLPGVGHTPMLEDPRSTEALVLSFATAISQTDSSRRSTTS